MKILMIFFLAGLLFRPENASGANLPVIAAEGKAEVDFGVYPANKRQNAVFKIRNKGNSLLEILRITNTCGCAETECDKKSLKPGETAQLRTAVLPDSIYGKYDKKIYVKSNDPANKVFAFTLKGQATPIAEVKPKDKFYAGRLETDKNWTCSFSLVPTEKKVELGTPFLESSYPMKAALTREKDGSYKLAAETLIGKAGGDLKAAIHVPVLEPKGWKPVRITILAKIGKEFFAVPSKLFLPETAKENVEKVFQLRMSGEKINAGLIKWETEIEGMSFRFGGAESDGSQLDAVAVFTPEALAAIAAQGQVAVSFDYPGAENAAITLKSNQ